MIAQRTKNSVSNLTVLALSVALFSYPFTSSIIVLLGLPSTTSFAFKILIFGIYSFYFFKTFRYKGKVSSANLFLFCLLIVYSIRILVDIFIFNIESEFHSIFYILSYFFLLTLLPVVSFLKFGRFLDIKKFNRIIMYLILIINALYIILSFSLGKDLVASFATRLTVASKEATAISIINPITIGLNGTIAIIYGVFKLAFFRPNNDKALCWSMIILGSINLILSASRGPLVTLVLLSFIIGYKYFTNNEKSLTFSIKIISWCICGGFIFMVVLPTLRKIDFFLLDRITQFIDGRDGPEARNYIIESAINDFTDNPIFGSHIFDTKYNAFAHNALIDTLMSCGVIGGLLLIFSFRNYIRNFFLLIRRTYEPEKQLFFLYISPMILIGMTSGSLIFFPEFWISLALLSNKSLLQ